MDQFHENLLRAESIKDLYAWSVMCAKDLSYEYEIRKKIRAKAKEVLSSHQEDMGLLGNANASKKGVEKIGEYQLRELYWSYFRIATKRLSKLYNRLSQKVETTEELINNPGNQKKIEETAAKLRVYIAELEEKIEANFVDIDEIQMTLKKHEFDKEIAELDSEDEIRQQIR